jgi:hypothetical protein
LTPDVRAQTEARVKTSLACACVLLSLAAACSSQGDGSAKSGSAKAGSSGSPRTSGSSSAAAPGPTSAQTTTALALPSSIRIGPPGDSGATISYDPDGPNHMDESRLHGDAKACAVVKSCCQDQKGPLALGCQLALSESAGDCTKMAETVRKLASELGQPPAGCK